jgi:hypothetical protein
MNAEKLPDNPTARREFWKSRLSEKPLPATANWWVGDDVLDLLEQAFQAGLVAGTEKGREAE